MKLIAIAVADRVLMMLATRNVMMLATGSVVAGCVVRMIVLARGRSQSGACRVGNVATMSPYPSTPNLSTCDIKHLRRGATASDRLAWPLQLWMTSTTVKA